jgi:MOSC domain-containing protein YiiM
METGKVLTLYMTMPDMMRSGHRMKCDDFECDPGGIFGDKNYENEPNNLILLVSKKSYDIIEEADLYLDKGVLMENIYVDVDLNHLKKGSVIEIGETIFEVTGPCHAYNYLYAFSPELPELLQNKRGIFIMPIEPGHVEIGDDVSVLKEA